MSGFAERLKTRVPSWQRFFERARADGRNVAYDLLPVLGLEARDRLSATLAAFQPKTQDFRPSLKAQGLNEALRQHGLSAMQGPLPPQITADLLAYFKATPCHDPYRPHLGSFKWSKPPSNEVNIGYYTSEEVIGAPHMLDVINNSDILGAAELWFGCKPTIDNIGASWSYPGRETAKGAQRFHRDFDCSRSFKLFIYLTDVDETCGPHVYVRGSNRKPVLETGRAQTDDAVIAAFGEDAITPIHGPAGSWFLEDVYGFHKGTLPQLRPRLLVGIEYNLYPSPLAPKAPVLARAPGYDPFVNRVFISP